jgi:hypothetical protein
MFEPDECEKGFDFSAIASAISFGVAAILVDLYDIYCRLKAPEVKIARKFLEEKKLKLWDMSRPKS